MSRDEKKSRSSRPDTSRINTLGQQARQLEDLLDELDRSTGKGSAKRSHARSAFREQAILTTVRQPEGGEVELRLACRNLSVGGMSLMHSAFLHPGTQLSVDLPLASGGIRRVDGKVVRCSHVKGMIHEIGVKFHEPIHLREFQRTDPFDMVFSYENVKPADLKGMVVHLDPSEIDRKIVRHILRDTALSIRGVETTEEALTLIEKGCDVIIMEYGLNDSDAAMFTSMLRSEGHMQPVIVVSSNTTKDAANLIRRSAIEVFLPKPIDADRLMSALAEFLYGDAASSDSKNNLAPSEAMKELASLFSKDLSTYADKLEAALNENDDEAIFRIAIQIRGTALSLGLTQLGTLASDVSDRLGDRQSPAMLTRQIRKLITHCRSPRPVS